MNERWRQAVLIVKNKSQQQFDVAGHSEGFIEKRRLDLLVTDHTKAN